MYKGKTTDIVLHGVYQFMFYLDRKILKI